MQVTQENKGSYVESRSDSEQSVRLVLCGGTEVCDIFEAAGITRTKNTLHLYSSYANAMADVTANGWTYGPRAQAHLERKGLL